MSLIALIVLAGVSLAVYRQARPRPLRPAALVAVPVVLIVLGAPVVLGGPLSTAAIGLLVVNLVVSVGFGVMRGRSERLWRAADGVIWRSSTRRTALLWAGTVLARVAAAGAAVALGVHAPLGGELELFLGISLAAQFAVVAARSGLVGRGAPLPVAG